MEADPAVARVVTCAKADVTNAASFGWAGQAIALIANMQMGFVLHSAAYAITTLRVRAAE